LPGNGALVTMSGRTRGARHVRFLPLLWAFALVCGPMIPQVMAQSAPVASPVADPQAPPSVTAKAVFVEDATAGTPLYELDADEPLSMASTTKLMTALVIAHNTADWQELVTADPSDVLDPEEGESMIGLLDGDVLTV